MRFSPWAVVSVALIVLGLGFWIMTGLANGNWTDIGVYSIVVTLVGLGLFGLLASRRPASA